MSEEFRALHKEIAELEAELALKDKTLSVLAEVVWDSECPYVFVEFDDILKWASKKAKED